MLPDRRAVWPHVADPPCRVLCRCQHRRRIRPAQQEGVSSFSGHRPIVTHRGGVRIAVLPGGLLATRRGLVGPQRPPKPRPISHVEALLRPGSVRPPPSSTDLHNLQNVVDLSLMSDQLPRLGGLSEPEKYERLVERVPGVWWSDAGPFAGLHELNAVRVEYFRRVFGGFGGKRVLDVGCGGGILAETLAAEGATVAGIDPSQKSLAAAREQAPRSGLTIDYPRGTAADFGGARLRRGFVLLFAADVVEHVDDPERN